MSRPRILLFPGWAYAAESLAPLARALRDVADIEAAGGTTRFAAAGASLFLLGWSMGGMMALQRSADAPGQCAGLILLSATTRFGGSAEAPHGTSPRVLRAMKAAMARNPDSVLRDFFRKCAAPAVLPDDVAAAQVAAALNTGVEHLRAGLDYLERTDLQGLVAGSELPVLVCHGDEDRIIPWQAGRDLAAALPRARFVRFNGIGHDLPLRAPAELAQHITAFIRTCRSTTKE